MDDLWAILGTLATIVLPMALAGWLLGRPSKRHSSRRDPRGNMRRHEDR